jgi:glycosyltransferase involved in cell wall biosynthesis
MQNKKKFSVIVPMYNTKNIAANLRDYIKQIEKFEKNFEIVAVDDGSTSNCLREAKTVKDSRLKIVHYDKNEGKGNAIKYGFKFAKSDYVGFLDSGAEYNAYLFKNFFRVMNKERADVVIGSKRHPKSKVYYPLLRRIISRCYQLMNLILFHLNVRDTQVGIKLFKREVLNKVMPKILVKKFAYDIEILSLAKKYKYKIVEAPIVLNYKFGSTIKLKSIITMLIDTLAVFYRLKILKYYDKQKD